MVTNMQFVNVLIATLICLGMHSLVSAQDQRGPPEPRVIFISSETGNGILSSWPSAGGMSGLAAADNVCQTLASNAGLSNSANFIAWLSDSSDDAYCRLHGFGGKRSANCGQGSLPESAGPWNRTDGTPFGGAIPELLDFNPLDQYTPLRFDETGTEVGISLVAFTATNTDGSLQQDTCSDWTSDTADGSVRIRFGNSYSTGWGWTNSGTTNCSAISNAKRLVCIERLPGPAITLPEDVVANIAFVTSVAGNGDLSGWADADPGTSGIEAGDSICNNLAAQEGLPFQGKYKAWLSDDTTNAIDRFETDGPWKRLDEFQFAANKADLTDGKLFTSINQEDDQGRTNSVGVWTGTLSDGTADVNNCNNWAADSVVTGKRGISNSSIGSWTEGFGSVDCSFASNRLYCFSDADLDVNFEDGFESSD